MDDLRFDRESLRRQLHEARSDTETVMDECGELRTRVESVEAALREAERRCQGQLVCGDVTRCWLCESDRRHGRIQHYARCPFAALGAAGEKENRSDG